MGRAAQHCACGFRYVVHCQGMEPIKLMGNFGPSLERADLIEQIEAAQAKMSECAYGSEEYYQAMKEREEAKRAHAATFNRRK